MTFRSESTLKILYLDAPFCLVVELKFIVNSNIASSGLCLEYILSLAILGDSSLRNIEFLNDLGIFLPNHHHN